MKIVTAGTGMAASEFVETLRRHGSKDDITMISPETFPPYSPCSMPFFLAGEPIETVYWKGIDFYKRYGINPILDESIVKVDTTRQEIETNKGRKIPYDKLLFATGSKSWFPAPEMLEIKGVFGFKTLTDLVHIDEYIKKEHCKRAVVFGGGFIGTDAALSMWHRGLDITLVHRNNRLLSQMTDEDGGKFATRRIHEKTGIDIRLKNIVERVESDNGKIKSVVLTDGSVIETDILVISIGVSPNSEPIKNNDKGVETDCFLQYAENVYVAGDVALTDHMVTGKKGIYATYPNARNQARNAAWNILFSKEPYHGSINTNVLKKHIDFPIISAGIFEGEVYTYSDDKYFRRIYLKDGKINGYQIVGDTLMSGYVYNLYISRKTIPKDFLKAFSSNDNKYYYSISVH